MGHQFARAAVAAAIGLVLQACGDAGAGSRPAPVLENAREQVALSVVDGRTTPATSAPDDVILDSIPDELPAPDPSTFDGANRVVNLWVGATGETGPIDVWGRRTFTNGPILLAENIAFGTASDYFGAPPGYRLAVVGAGAGADGDELARVFNATTGEQITTLFTSGEQPGDTGARNVFEHGADDALAAPADGSGVALLVAANLGAFAKELIASVGANEFAVGDGSAACRPQRHEPEGVPPVLLGATQRVDIAVTPGPQTISLHPASTAAPCTGPSVLDVPVDVTAGGASVVVVYARDGTGVEALVLPVARDT